MKTDSTLSCTQPKKQRYVEFDFLSITLPFFVNMKRLLIALGYVLQQKQRGDNCFQAVFRAYNVHLGDWLEHKTAYSATWK